MKKIILLASILCLSTSVFAKEEAPKKMVAITNSTNNSITIELEYYKKNKEVSKIRKGLTKGKTVDYDYKDEEKRVLSSISLVVKDALIKKFDGTDIKERGVYVITQ